MTARTGYPTPTTGAAASALWLANARMAIRFTPTSTGRGIITMSEATNHETLTAIIDYIDDFGHPPSIRELGRVLSLSHSTIHDRLVALEDSDQIKRVGPRKIIIVKENV